MPHFMQLIDNTCLGALNFTDADMNPIERTLTIKGVKKQKPPAGGKEKPCIEWTETPKVSFLPTGQLKALANKLMVADTDRWIGARVTLTCGEVKSVKGGMTMGVIVVKAEKPRGGQPAPAQAKPAEIKPSEATEPNPEDDGRE